MLRQKERLLWEMHLCRQRNTALTFKVLDWHSVNKHQVTVGNLAHETCRFQKCLRNLEQKHVTMNCRLSFASVQKKQQQKKSQSVPAHYLCVSGLESSEPLGSLCSWWGCCYTHRRRRCLRHPALAVVLRRCLSSSLDPNVVPGYTQGKKKNIYVAGNEAAWTRRRRSSHLHNLPFLDWVES